MIIIGDVACPNEKYSQKLASFFEENKQIFQNNKLICNLEGLICEDISHLPQDTPVLYNHPSVLDTLSKANTVGVGMANNHTLDLPEYLQDTKRILSNKGLLYTGAGTSKEAAQAPFTYQEGEKEIMVFNYCWDFLLYHQDNPSKGTYVAELDEHYLLKEVAKRKKSDSDLEIVVYLHWSFDLETLPFPMYRQFAQLLIEAGATLVIGCHSHCVQGGEKYKDGYIVYGLGNFFIPHSVYAGGKLSFPAMSDLQLAFEYDFENRVATCHWFKYNHKVGNLVEYVNSEQFEESSTLKTFSPYATMTQAQYVNYFKENRRKKLLVPIYKDIHQSSRNKVCTAWLKVRASVLRGLAKYNLRKWQN